VQSSRPKIGLLFLAGDSWWEMGVWGATQGRYAGFKENVEQDARRAREGLARLFDVVSSGIIHTVDGAVQEARRFNDERVDAVVYCPIVWTNDQPLVAFLREARRVPILLWSYDPYDRILDYYRIGDWLRASAPVSVQQSTNILTRMGWPYESCFGNEDRPQTKAALTAFAKSARVAASLHGTKIAVFPSPCRVVISTWIDELELLSRLGVELVPVSVAELLSLMRETSDAEVADAVAFLERYPASEVTPRMLSDAARQSCAMVRMIDRYGLSGIALEDFNREFYQSLGYRPHLYHPGFGERGCTVGLEADVLGVLATVIVGRLSGATGMFTEFYTIDPHANRVLMGHPGYGELGFADPGTIEVTPDIEIDDSQPRGVWISYRARPGRMTLLNLTAEKQGLKGGVWSGECLGGPRLMEGYAHMLIAPDTDAERLFTRINESALFQHWGAAYGDIARELSFLLRGIGVRAVDLA
jgi:L-fucose isomerase-like protein